MTHAASIKTLKAYYNDRVSPIDPAELIAELDGTSDRSTVVVLAAFIDDAIQFLIFSKMRPGLTETEHREAFRNEGPIGTFSAKIEIAYLFGYIENDLRLRLHALREMRNACAHSRRAMSFKILALANVCKRFMNGAEFAPENDTPESLRRGLIAECFFLFNVLIDSREQAVADLRASVERYKNGDLT